MSDLQLDDTLFLVQRPSFLNGVARSTDLFGNFTEYNYSKDNILIRIEASGPTDGFQFTIELP